jgi:hypothetical protein
MIRAHMATYPKRRDILEHTVRSLARQVDRLYLVLNEFTEVPEEIARIDRVEPIIPVQDLKDVGKFLPEAAADDLVFLADDDIHYADGYVDWMLVAGETVGLDQSVIGLHGSLYGDVAGRGPGDRKVWSFYRKCRQTICVDQLGSGAMLALGRNVAPLSYMQGSQKFVDVRYAAWLNARGISSWCIARNKSIARQLVPNDGSQETIFSTFTQTNPTHVVAEILQFAGKGQRLGEVLR